MQSSFVITLNSDFSLAIDELFAAAADKCELPSTKAGQDALNMADKYQPDIVLLDIGLPGMDGYEAARRTRKHPELKEVKLIAVTGYGQEADRLQSQEAGFDYHLVKPVDAQKLQEVMVALMKPSE